MKEIYRRTLTGAWIVIFTLGGFWLHPVSFFLTGLIILSGTQYEYLRIIRSTGVNAQMIPGMLTGIAVYILATLVASGILGFRYLLILIPFIAGIMIFELYRRQDNPFDSLAHTIFSVIYTALPFSFFPFAAFGREGINPLIRYDGGVFSPGIIIGFFVLLWVNDTGAYLSGITFGKHRLLERISPKKSWEGFAGGIILSVLSAWLLSGLLGVLDTPEWIIVALLVAVSGTFGDLIESMFKRSTGIKDSGSIMPGHGGFMDRFDSTLLSFPLVFLFITFFG
ncbi:MAG TPA: phosphatidate cytidylyltransferase [Bacteroidales bacterium]|nr:phosphatidate cytidylyltransferase [Bacteroidales bacterium]HOX75147.1 phosphatidate cytidylyltransferase [Bacteroidales bacterium]HPM88590.1 phosphatidate cytidylyltransferase [Bacteroidales bacterium]HQM67657.1 phosphatidate cytidylyltransferase [Bacteroidales bacterium]